MTIVDTNMISELMRPEPDLKVAAWVRLQPKGELFTTSVNEGELCFGIASLPAGLRRTELATMADGIFHEAFAGRVLVFDRPAAAHFGEIGARRRRHGHPIDPLDCQIAAIARCHRARVATRNTRHFADCGVEVINPWQEQ